jgi:hypothetical protein
MPGPRKKKIRLDPNTEVDATVMPFQTVMEHFNEYLVDDGTVVQIKLVATEIVKIDDAYDEQGQPVYVIGSTNVTTISVPEELKRPEGGSPTARAACGSTIPARGSSASSPTS